MQKKAIAVVNKAGNKIGADELPAVTQLFTEDYMVDFLLDNTLGAWWAGKVLAANPKIDAVFCENDSMCLGAQRAIADAGRTDEMFLCGVDGETAALEAIMNETNYACTGLNNSDQIGRAAGRKRHDKADRPRRKSLRACGTRPRGCCGGPGNLQKCSARKCHCLVLILLRRPACHGGIVQRSRTAIVLRGA